MKIFLGLTPFAPLDFLNHDSGLSLWQDQNLPMITQEKKSKVIDTYRTHPKDTGSTEVQIALLTARIEELTEHFKMHNTDALIR